MTLSHSPNIVRDGLVFSFDPANKKSYSPNVFPYPTDFYSFAQNGSGRVTVSRDNIESPVGNTPLKMTQIATGGRGYTISYNNAAYNIAPAAAGETWTFSFWAKSSVDNVGTAAMYIFGANSSGIAFVDGAWLNLFGKGIQLTTDWQRFEYTITFNNPDVTYIQVRVDTDNDAAIGDEFWYDGFQVEKSSSATPFNPNYYNQSKTVYNLVNNSQTGTLATIQECSSDNIRSLIFDGTSDYITLDGSSFDFSTGQTINLILKKGTGAHSARRNPYNQAYGGYGTITSETNGTFNYYHGTNGANGTPYDSFNNSSVVPENELIMLTLTRDTNNVAWYINGELDVTEATAYPVTTSTVDNILIGEGYAGPPFLGEIKYVALYERGLSAAEVKQNFQALRGRFGL